MIKLTNYGRKEWLGTGILALIFIIVLICLGHQDWGGFYFFAFLVFVIWLGIAAFFRDPDRNIPEGENIMLSPADGVVKDINVLEETEFKELFKNKPVLRFGIFLSVLNVHINRAPCKLRVVDVIYKEGKFHDARNELSIRENESNAILCMGSVKGREFPLVIKQISGAIARRIVCNLKKGDVLEAGEKFGMIKFGSRTEIYVLSDKNTEFTVHEGSVVCAGTSIIADIK